MLATNNKKCLYLSQAYDLPFDNRSLQDSTEFSDRNKVDYYDKYSYSFEIWLI